MAKAFGKKDSQGIVVGDVSVNSPAQKAGIQRGDIILQINDKPVSDSNQLRMSVSMMQPGTELQLKILRNGTERDETVKLAEMPTESAKVESIDQEGGSKALEGVEVTNLNAGIAKELGISSATKGVVVTDIDPASKMADSGLQKGDLIQEVNHQPVGNVSEFQSALRKAGSDPLLLVNREGRTLFIAP
jgi:serine protease Do